jgi:hypothetical protein
MSSSPATPSCSMRSSRRGTGEAWAADEGKRGRGKGEKQTGPHNRFSRFIDPRAARAAEQGRSTRTFGWLAPEAQRLLAGGFMSLIICPACGRQISQMAAACPQCGHPNHPTNPTVAGPKCYACSATATTRCQSCGALSCAQHLQTIRVSDGRTGWPELRCASCYPAAEENTRRQNTFACIFFPALFLFLIFLYYFLVSGGFRR